MTKIKICGLRTGEEAIAARDMGADFLGFIFVSGAKRCLEASFAKSEIAKLKDRPSSNHYYKTVGLFADQPIETVNRIAVECDLDIVQLCGGESLDYCKTVEKEVIKSVHIKERGTQEDHFQLVDKLNQLERNGYLVTLDRFQKGIYGGTGTTFDWEVAQELAINHRFLLAGGLTPENVALAINKIKPWGVDVSSGIETNGKKDVRKIAEFIHTVRLL